MAIGTTSTCDVGLSFVPYVSAIFDDESDNGKYVCYQATDSVGNTSYSQSNMITGIVAANQTVPDAGGNVVLTGEETEVVISDKNQPLDIDIGNTV
jgi:hypothetical protein